MNSCDGFSGAVLIAAADGKVIYWSPTAAAEFGWREVESRSGEVPGVVPTASDAPNAIHPVGSPSADAPAQRVKVILKSGRMAWLESRMMRLLDAAGGADGHLYLLQRKTSGEQSPDKSECSPAVKPSVTERQVLHQLNNVFASIHSSLDLALGAKEPAGGGSFLQQAQESARRGALIINELQLRELEVPGAASSSSGTIRANSSVSVDSGDEPTPAALEGTERLLLAEDDKSMRALIRAVLAYRGYTVIEAVDGEEAVSKYFADGPFDLVILDMEMPKLEGAAVLQRLRAQNPSVRALALSGSLFGREEETPGSGDRFDGFLNKPFRNLDLVKLVRRILDRPAAA